MRFGKDNLRAERILLHSPESVKNRFAMFLENDLFKSKTHVSHRWILEKCEAWVFPKKILDNVQSIRWRGDNKD